MFIIIQALFYPKQSEVIQVLEWRLNYFEYIQSKPWTKWKFKAFDWDEVIRVCIYFMANLIELWSCQLYVVKNKLSNFVRLSCCVNCHQKLFCTLSLPVEQFRLEKSIGSNLDYLHFRRNLMPTILVPYPQYLFCQPENIYEHHIAQCL